MNECIVELIDGTSEDYHVLCNILKEFRIESDLKSFINENDMGLGLPELVLVMAASLPYIQELQKAFSAYLEYRKPLNKKVHIRLKNGSKEIEIDSENTEIPSIEAFNEFFN